MYYVAAGAVGFLFLQGFDIACLKKSNSTKAVIWVTGCGLLGYGIVMASLWPDKLALPAWSWWLGLALLPVSLLEIVHSLFVDLPFVRTYVSGSNDRLVRTGLYSLVRHPGVAGLGLFLLSLLLVSQSRLLLVGAPVWFLLDVLHVTVQDRLIFPRLFSGYADYRRETPMLIPNKSSVDAFLNRFIDMTNLEGGNKVSIPGELLRQGKYEELWQRYCSFIDLNLKDFMMIQRRLLLEQMEMFNRSELGKIIMHGAQPGTVEEFRSLVPLTSYEDYAPYLLKRRMDVLPQKPLVWMRTSGRSGGYTCKWVPLTSRQYEEMGNAFLAILLLASARGRGNVNLREHDKLLYALAPAPYFSGVAGHRIFEEGVLDILPPLEEAEKVDFSERIQRGFKMALFDGMDLFAGISSILVAVGERFSQGNRTVDLKALLGNPKALLRATRGVLRSKLARRPLLPRDIWSLKCVIASGTDTPVYRDRIKEMWGCYPMDIYACTEATVVAMQTWDNAGMTFVPYLNFLEFIPQSESIKSRQDPSYRPMTLLLDEVKAGENYEIVVTNFYGGALVRYRVGDMVTITSLRNDKLDIDIPQMAFYSRVDDIIDIAGFTRLTEGVIWRAIEKSGIAYKDWTVRKEVREKPLLRLYLEFGENENVESDRAAEIIHEQLKIMDSDYANLESFIGLKPLVVTRLPAGAFDSYRQKQQAAGADLAHLKVPHVNPSDAVLHFLLTGESRPAVVASQLEGRTEVVSR